MFRMVIYVIKSKQIGYKAKQRNSRSRKRKNVLLFSTEGNNKTETLYLRNLNSDRYVVRFCKGNYTNPLGMVNTLIREYEDLDLNQNDGDLAYCLVDSDINKQKETEIFKALRKAKKNHIQLIISNPCFEIWYLCHFVYSTAQYNSNDEVIQKIKEYIPNYSKNLDSVYELISNKTYQAIQNAEKLEIFNLENKREKYKQEFSPSTDVYKIFKEIGF